LENAAAIGLPIPKKLKDVLEQLNGKAKEEGEKGYGKNNDKIYDKK